MSRGDAVLGVLAVWAGVEAARLGMPEWWWLVVAVVAGGGLWGASRCEKMS